jgi:hypothetical protein
MGEILILTSKWAKSYAKSMAPVKSQRPSVDLVAEWECQWRSLGAKSRTCSPPGRPPGQDSAACHRPPPRRGHWEVLAPWNAARREQLGKAPGKAPSRIMLIMHHSYDPCHLCHYLILSSTRLGKEGIDMDRYGSLRIEVAEGSSR